jgi:hypothetical protein
VPFAAANLSGYEPAGYTLTLGPTLNSKIAITGSGGAAVAY